MTANVFKEDIEKCLKSGMNDHTGKPLDTAVLFALLDKHLNHSEEPRIRKNVSDLPMSAALDTQCLTGGDVFIRLRAWHCLG